MNPFPFKDNNSILCTRVREDGWGEIWRVDYLTGKEACIVSEPFRGFSTPSLSPDGNWIVMVGSNGLMNGRKVYFNTDIFVCRADGTEMKHLTRHAADDMSPVWSKDGKHIYFISQRGSAKGTANVWRLDFVQ